MIQSMHGYLKHFQSSGERLTSSSSYNFRHLKSRDFFSASFSTESELKQYVLENFGLDLGNKDGIRRFNTVFSESLSFYKNILLRDYPKALPKKFSSLKEIFEFVKRTADASPISQSRCSVLKVCTAVNDVLTNSALEGADKKMENLLRDKFWKGIFWEDANFPLTDNFSHGVYVKLLKNKKGETVGQKKIDFSISFRHKDKDKTILKLLYNDNYSSSRELKDLFGIRIEVKSVEDAVYMAELIQLRFWPEIENNTDDCDGFQYDGQSFFVKNKNLFGSDDIKPLKQNLSPNLFDILSETVSKNGKKGITDKKYRDFKFVGDTLSVSVEGIKETYGVEIRIVLVGNDNETKFAHHGIFDAKKIVSAMVRLQGYVSQAYVSSVIADTLSKNPDIKISPEKILEHFQNSFLLKISIKSSNTYYYISKERFNELYKRGVIGEGFMVFDFKNQSWLEMKTTA